MGWVGRREGRDCCVQTSGITSACRELSFVRYPGRDGGQEVFSCGTPLGSRLRARRVSRVLRLLQSGRQRREVPQVDNDLPARGGDVSDRDQVGNDALLAGRRRQAVLHQQDVRDGRPVREDRPQVHALLHPHLVRGLEVRRVLPRRQVQLLRHLWELVCEGRSGRGDSGAPPRPAPEPPPLTPSAAPPPPPRSRLVKVPSDLYRSLRPSNLVRKIRVRPRPRKQEAREIF